jgi:hypothetical protein
MNEFIKLEYEQCMSLLKYYDERHQSFVKFAAGLSSGVPALLLAIFQLGHDANQYFWQFTALISLVTAIGLLSIFTVLVQLRLYFVYPVRQVNALRRYMLEHVASDFHENQMYLDTNFSAFKWSSAHTLLNAFVALQIGLFVGLFTYSVEIVRTVTECRFAIAVVTASIVSMICFGLSAWYLYSKSKAHPDISVHGRKET